MQLETSPYLYKPTGEQSYRSAYLLTYKFAHDLAPLLHGKVSQANDDDQMSEWSRMQIELPSGLILWLGSSSKSRAQKWHIDSGLPWKITSPVHQHYSRLPKFPDATISANKPLAQIAKEISRRVISQANEPLAQWLQKAEEYKQSQNSLANQVKAFSQRFPWLQIRHEDGKAEANVYANTSAPEHLYLNGRLNADGHLYIERIGGLSPRLTLKLLEALSPESK